MTEEVKVENKAADPPEHTEIETKAMSMGWRPKDQWTGPEEEFTDAGEFVRRQPLFDKIEYQNKKIKNVELALNQLTEHHSRVRQIEYDRAINELKSIRKDAIREGHGEEALEAEERIDALKEEFSKLPPITKAAPTTESTPEFQEWVKTNSWYLQDVEMMNFADSLANGYIKKSQANGTIISERDIFNYVTPKVKNAYPEKFGNPNRERPSAVGVGDQNGKTVRKSSFQLSPEQEDVARSFERNGIMTREKYIAEVKKLEGVE